jgi:hypothetical protein
MLMAVFFDTLASSAKRCRFATAEELYDIKKDPYCLVNLINQPELIPVKQDLSTQLDAWMLAQGDQGWETELKATERTKKTSSLWEQIRSQK